MAFRARTIGLRKIAITITQAGLRQPLAQENIFVTDFEVYVKSGNSGANMYVGDKTVANTWIPRAKGTTTNFVHGTGNYLGADSVVAFNLKNIYMDADTTGDQAIIQYYAGEREEV